MPHVPVPVLKYEAKMITNPYQSVPVQWNNKWKQQCDGAGEHLNCDKLRVAGHGVGNTRARRTNTAKRAPNMPMHHGHVTVHVVYEK